MQKILTSFILLFLCSCSGSKSERIESVSFHSFNPNEIYVSDVYFDGEEVRVPVGYLSPNASATTLSAFSILPQAIRVNYQINGDAFTNEIYLQDLNESMVESESSDITLYIIYTEEGKFIPKLHFGIEGDYRGIQGELHPDQNLEDYRSYKRVLQAVVSEDYQTLKVEVDDGSPLYWSNEPVSNSPIEWAALNGNIDCLNIILSKNIDYPSFVIANSLKLAAQDGHIEILKALLKEQYTEGINNQDLQTILYSTVSLNASSSPKAIIMLLEYFDLSIDFRLRDYGHTLLIVACQSGKKEIVEFLVKRGANTELTLEDGSRAIDIVRDEEIKKILRKN